MQQPKVNTTFPVWLMRSKILPGEQLVSLIERPELLRKLNLGLKGKLTHISTPPGYGKTTLLESWRNNLLANEYQVAWLSLDDDDNEPGLLATYIAYSLWEAGLKDSICQLTAEGFGPHISPKTTLGIISAAAIKSNKKLILILDDFQMLTIKSIQMVIEPALKYFPDNIHIVIACRGKAELRLSELRLSGQINELGSMDIRFTVEEIKTFLQNFLNKNQIQLVAERTEGWPVALQYLRIALSNSTDHSAVLKNFKGTAKKIDDYFSEQFLSTINEDKASFLLESSILEYITINAVDYIRKREDSEYLLDSMKEIDAFIVHVDDKENHYQLHPLLREYLQNNLRKNQPEKYRMLQQMAAHWHAKNGHIIRAMNYALKINEEDLAGEIIEQAGGVLLWNREGMARIRAANALLPDTVISQRPRLQLMKALVLLKDGKLNEGREIIQYVSNLKLTSEDRLLRYDIAVMISTLDAYEGSNATEDINQLRNLLFELGNEDDAQISFIYTACCISSFQQGHLDEARDFAYKGISKLREFKMLFGLAYFEFHLGVIDFAEGQLNSSFSRYQKAQNAIRHYFSDDKDMKLVLNILMAEWYYENNQISTAKRLLGDTNNRLVNGEAWYEIYAAGYSTSTSIAYENEGLDACRQLTSEANHYIQREGLKRLRRLVNANMAGYLTRSGELKAARKIIQENGLSLDEYKTPNKEYSLIRERYGVVLSLCRLLIAEQRYPEAINELKFFIKLEQSINYIRAALKYNLLLSLALFFSGKHKKSFELLNTILTKIRNEGFIRLILDENPLVKPLLKAYTLSVIAKEKDHGNYLLNFLEENIKVEEVTRLSKREHQVLKQLAKGFPDKVIARNLDVSSNTIRFHLKNIYTKLGVNSRLQAVKEAANLP